MLASPVKGYLPLSFAPTVIVPIVALASDAVTANPASLTVELTVAVPDILLLAPGAIHPAVPEVEAVPEIVPEPDTGNFPLLSFVSETETVPIVADAPVAFTFKAPCFTLTSIFLSTYLPPVVKVCFLFSEITILKFVVSAI